MYERIEGGPFRIKRSRSKFRDSEITDTNKVQVQKYCQQHKNWGRSVKADAIKFTKVCSQEQERERESSKTVEISSA